MFWSQCKHKGMPVLLAFSSRLFDSVNAALAFKTINAFVAKKSDFFAILRKIWVETNLPQNYGHVMPP
jgi:hypothetical protein